MKPRLLPLLLLACSAEGCGRVSQRGEPAQPTFEAVFWAEEGAFALLADGSVTPLDAPLAYGVSADRRQVALGNGNDAVSEIVSATGSRVSLPMQGRPVWSPDSKRLAFSRGGVPFIAEATGEAAQAVDRPPIADGELFHIRWSPNSRYAAFTYLVSAPDARPGVPFSQPLLVVDAESLSVVETAVGDYPFHSVQFSPTSSRLGMVGADLDGLLMDANGGHLAALATSAVDGAGGWSFDGNWFALGNTVAYADGEAFSTLNGGDRNVQGDAWSPTTDTLAYFSLSAGLGLWSATGATTLTHIAPSDLRWSPAGDYLAYQATADTGWVSVVIEPGSKSELIRIPTAASDLHAFAWNPTGSRLFATNSNHDLQVANADGTHLQTLASGVVDAIWLPDGDQIAFATIGGVSVARASDGTSDEVWSGSRIVVFVPPQSAKF